MNAPALLAWLPAAALLVACGQTTTSARTPVDAAKIVDTIKTDEVHWNADFKSGDAARIVAHFAPKATVMMPGSAPMVGVPAIQAALAQAVGDPGFTNTFASDKVDVAASGDLAVARGGYKTTSTDAKTKAIVTTSGAYVTVYKPMADGTWKATWDIVSPGAPATVGVAMSDAASAKAVQ